MPRGRPCKPRGLVWLLNQGLPRKPRGRPPTIPPSVMESVLDYIALSVYMNPDKCHALKQSIDELVDMIFGDKPEYRRRDLKRKWYTSVRQWIRQHGG